MAAIEDQAYARQTWATVRRDREILAEGLALGFDVTASQTSFVLAQTPRDVSALHLYQALKEAGILVRYFNTPRLQDSLRITVEPQNKIVILISSLTLSATEPWR